MRKGVLRNFTKFTGKHLWHRYFAMNFSKFLRTHFFTEHIWTTASEIWGIRLKINLSITSITINKMTVKQMKGLIKKKLSCCSHAFPFKSFLNKSLRTKYNLFFGTVTRYKFKRRISYQ